jgi:hypothetical protein
MRMNHPLALAWRQTRSPSASSAPLSFMSSSGMKIRILLVREWQHQGEACYSRPDRSVNGYHGTQKSIGIVLLAISSRFTYADEGFRLDYIRPKVNIVRVHQSISTWFFEEHLTRCGPDLQYCIRVPTLLGSTPHCGLPRTRTEWLSDTDQ